MKKIMVVFVLAVIFLSACTSSVTSGTVTAKYYEPERVWVQMIPTTIGKVVVMIPITYYDDEDWILTITDSDGNTGYVYVEQSVYESVEIGSFYKVSDPSQLSDTDREEQGSN